MSDYLRIFFYPGSQLVFTGVFVACSFWLATALGMLPSRSARSWVLVGWWVWSFGFLIGNGGYWAIITPQYVYFVAKSRELAYDRIAPGETPGIRALSSMLGTYALMNSVGLAVVFLAFSTINFPAGPEKARFVANTLLLAGGLVVFYSFVYPQAVLVRLVLKLKAVGENELLDLQEEIVSSGEPRPGQLEKVHMLLDRLRSSKSSPLATRVIFKYASSAAVALAAFAFKEGWTNEGWTIVKMLHQAIGK